jgi:hypothetical protein
MTKNLSFVSAGVIVALFAAALAIVAFNGTTSADGGDDAPVRKAATDFVKPPMDPDSMLAVAIGTIIDENEDADQTIDLRAHEHDGEEGGAFRFFCPMMGYYNGGVQTVDYEDGVITATGAGALWAVDGSKVKVQFVLTVDVDAGTAEVSITGPGVDYNVSGDLDGFSWAGKRGDAPPFAQQ